MVGGKKFSFSPLPLVIWVGELELQGVFDRYIVLSLASVQQPPSVALMISRIVSIVSSGLLNLFLVFIRRCWTGSSYLSRADIVFIIQQL